MSRERRRPSATCERVLASSWARAAVSAAKRDSSTLRWSARMLLMEACTSHVRSPSFSSTVTPVSESDLRLVTGSGPNSGAFPAVRFFRWVPCATDSGLCSVLTMAVDATAAAGRALVINTGTLNRRIASAHNVATIALWVGSGMRVDDSAIRVTPEVLRVESRWYDRHWRR